MVFVLIGHIYVIYIKHSVHHIMIVIQCLIPLSGLQILEAPFPNFINITKQKTQDILESFIQVKGVSKK